MRLFLIGTTSPRRIVPYAVAILLGIMLAALVARPSSATVLAPEMSITIWENGCPSSCSGDHWTRSGFGVGLYNANLAGDIANLTGTPLCNTSFWPVAGNDWNDCVSGISGAVAPGYRALFYRDANYGGGVYAIFCSWSTRLTLAGSDQNDSISSWRVVSGGC